MLATLLKQMLPHDYDMQEQLEKFKLVCTAMQEANKTLKRTEQTVLLLEDRVTDLKADLFILKELERAKGNGRFLDALELYEPIVDEIKLDPTNLIEEVKHDPRN